MPDWFLIAVFFAAYLMACICLAIVVWSIIKRLTNVAWIFLRKVFPKLPKDREEYYEQILEQGRRASGESVGISDRDEHQLH